MDSQSRAELDRILSVEPTALSETDWAFLKARRSYLTPEQEAIFFPKGESVAPKKKK